MSLLRFPKTFKHTNQIKIEKLLKRVDSDCILLVLTINKKRKIENLQLVPVPTGTFHNFTAVGPMN